MRSAAPEGQWTGATGPGSASTARARRVIALGGRLVPRQKAARADNPSRSATRIVPAAGVFGPDGRSPFPCFPLDMGSVRCFSWRGPPRRSALRREGGPPGRSSERNATRGYEL